ncbi:hypothetical protein FQA39_LY05640 [Lamprigera yunnana]|nr:hypothetical protein FQA39_LY05640 [Lamprigera yunnana]
MRRRRIVGMGVQATGPGRRGMACSRLVQSTYSAIGDLVQHIADGVHASNDDDMDDEDTNEEFSVKPSRHRDFSEVNSEMAEPSPGPSGSSETRPSESALSSPLAALAQVSQHLDARDAASLAMPGWDLQQLALYLLMERQGKQLEQAAREIERHSIARKWTRREEADFSRAVSSYGVNYFRKKKAYDWVKFKQLAKLDKKTDDEITDYYKHFVVMCKQQTGVKMEDHSYDISIAHISEEKARSNLERLERLSRIREEIVTHSKLDDILKVCVTAADMPEWWMPGKHDKDLLLGVAKHGLGRTDYYILNDPELSFQEILRKKVICTTTDTLDSKNAIKLESHEYILKFDKNEILVKLEKGEGTLKIEKVNVKKKNIEDKDKKKEENTKIELTLIKNEIKDELFI